MIASTNGWALVQALACRWEHALGARGVAPYCDRIGVRHALYRAYRREGVEGVLATYDTLQRTASDRFDFGPGELVSLAYELLHAGQGADAVRVFEAVVRRFPDDWNGHDSLGEAYLARGDTARAVHEYRRSIELNPQNTNGVAILIRLGH